MARIEVVPYGFGAEEPCEPVTIDTGGILFAFQTVRDDDIFDQEYRGKLLTRIVRAGFEVLTDEPLAAFLARWRSDDGLTLAACSRAPTSYAGDDPTVCVNAAKVTDVRPVPQDRYAKAYRALIRFGGVQVPVVEEPAEVRRRLGW